MSNWDEGFLSVSRRIEFLLTGILFPLGCVVFTAFGAQPWAGRMWQSGGIRIKAALLAGWPANSVMLPLILFSCVCLSGILYRPAYRRHVLVRMGVYSGALLSLVYLVLICLATGPVTFIAAFVVGVVGVVLLYVIPRMARYWRRFSLWHLLVFTTFMAFIAATVGYLDLHGQVIGYLGVAVFLVVAATPTWNFVTYLRCSLWLMGEPRTTHEASDAGLRAMVAWCCGTIAFAFAWYYSWRVSVEMMMDEYARLPVNPDCYVCSAGAHGHRRFVASKQVGLQPADGWNSQRRQDETHDAPAGFPVNKQMQRAKFLELALRAASPSCHRYVRMAYDRVGPKLARFCRASPWFADVAYLLLKPAELLAVTLRVVARMPGDRVARIYSNSEPACSTR